MQYVSNFLLKFIGAITNKIKQTILTCDNTHNIKEDHDSNEDGEEESTILTIASDFEKMYGTNI